MVFFSVNKKKSDIFISLLWSESGYLQRSWHVFRRFKKYRKQSTHPTLQATEMQPWGERLSGPTPRYLVTPRRGPQVPSNPRHPRLPDFSPTPIGHSSAIGDSNLQNSCTTTVFPHVLNTSPISVGTVADGGGFLVMPIPTKKCSNPNRYERILTADHKSWRKTRSIRCNTTICL